MAGNLAAFASEKNIVCRNSFAEFSFSKMFWFFNNEIMDSMQFIYLYIPVLCMIGQVDSLQHAFQSAPFETAPFDLDNSFNSAPFDNADLPNWRERWTNDIFELMCLICFCNCLLNENKRNIQ